MSATVFLHLTDKAAFRAPMVERGKTGDQFRTIDIRDGEGGEVMLFLNDEQARQLAETILTALYPVTAAMAEALDVETVQ